MSDIKVKIYGSANNRTVLAVMHVYMAMYPNTTKAELEKAFPATLGPSKKRDSLFYDVDTFEAFTKTDAGIETDWWVFKDKEDFLITSDGFTLTPEATWRGGDVENFFQYVRQFGIEAEVNKEVLEKGKKFKIEYQNGYDPEAKISASEAKSADTANTSFLDRLSSLFGGKKKAAEKPAKPEPAPAPKPEPKPAPAPAPKPEPKPEPAPAPRPEPKPAPAPSASGDTAEQKAFAMKFEAVDLGLPSGIKWANMNIGASQPFECGSYYAWGEIQTKENYDWSTYKHCNGSEKAITKYYPEDRQFVNDGCFFDNKTVLEKKDDVAHVKMGGKWRIPTKADFEELKSKCTWTWMSSNGRIGYIVKGPNGKSIFLPAAGTRSGSSLDYVGYYGYYWSASLNAASPAGAMELFIYSSGLSVGSDARRCGRCVRPVCD